jgi:hypothetical protein
MSVSNIGKVQHCVNWGLIHCKMDDSISPIVITVRLLPCSSNQRVGCDLLACLANSRNGCWDDNSTSARPVSIDINFEYDGYFCSNVFFTRWLMPLLFVQLLSNVSFRNRSSKHSSDFRSWPFSWPDCSDLVRNSSSDCHRSIFSFSLVLTAFPSLTEDIQQFYGQSFFGLCFWIIGLVHKTMGSSEVRWLYRRSTMRFSNPRKWTSSHWNGWIFKCTRFPDFNGFSTPPGVCCGSSRRPRLYTIPTKIPTFPSFVSNRSR